MYRRHGLVLGLGLVLLFLGQLAAQSTPQVIKLQGFLSDKSSGSSVPASGTFAMRFDLYNSDLGGLRIKSVGPLSVDATDGLYSVDLPFLTSHFGGSDRWIEITVEGETLAPRIRVVSTPFAYRAEQLDGFEGADLEESAEISAGDMNLQTQIDSINSQLATVANTLDGAYDEGGPGTGRTIHADAGPVAVEGPDGMHVTGPLEVGAGQLAWSAESGGIPAHFGSDSPLEVTKMAIGSNAQINAASSFGSGPVLEDRALVVEETFDLEDPHQNAIVAVAHVDPGETSSGDLTGLLGWLEVEPTVDRQISELEAVIGVVAHRADSTVDFARGLRSRIWASGAGSTGRIGEAAGLDIEIRKLGTAGTVSAGNIYYVKLNSSAALPATGSAYGLYVDDMSRHGSSSYSIYSGGGSDVAYFAGDIGVKTTTPTVGLEVSDRLRTTAHASGGTAPSTGKGLEVFYSSSDDEGFVTAVDRNTASDDLKPMRLTAGQLELWTGADSSVDARRVTLDSSGNVGIGVATPGAILDIDKGVGHGQVTLNGSAGGCLMIRDTDDAGWTECNTLDGALTCSIDADGVCDGS